MEGCPEVDIIEIEDYNKRWSEAFEKERRSISQVLGALALDILHIGSTAVPGMAAKPIVDILVAVEHIDSGAECVSKLVEVGYRYVPQDEDPDRIFLYKGMPRTHHVHIVRYGSPTYHKHVAFRDYLMCHEEVRDKYRQLKKDLASRFRNDRKAYVEGKTIFIEKVTEEALRQYRYSKK